MSTPSVVLVADPDEAPTASGRGVVATATVLTLVAALIHFAVAPEHLAEWWFAGWFMILTGAGQLVLGTLIALRFLRSGDQGTWCVTLLIVLHVGLVVTFVVVHTWGMPLSATWVLFDAAAAHLEPPGVPGIVATVAEVVAALLLTVRMTGRRRRVMADALIVTGVGLWVSRVLGYLP